MKPEKEVITNLLVRTEKEVIAEYLARQLTEQAGGTEKAIALIQLLKAELPKEEPDDLPEGYIEPTPPMPAKQTAMVILDAGHGGIDPKTGFYTTAPAKMFRHGTTGMHDGKGYFFEGVFNRKICGVLGDMLTAAGIRYEKVYHEYNDLPLNSRVRLINKLTAENKGKAFLFSVHGNAAPAGKESARGLSLFVSEKAGALSKQLADILAAELKSANPELRFLTEYPEKSYWSRNLRITTASDCPAVLSENGFFTNPEETKLMLRDDFIQKTAAAHYNAILKALTLF